MKRPAPLYERALAALYGPGSQTTGRTLDNVDQSCWAPRIRAAKAADDHIKAQHLEGLWCEVLEAGQAAKLSPDQIYRVSTLLHDAETWEEPRKLLMPGEIQQLQRRYGPDVQQRINAGYKLLDTAVKGCPTLLEAVTRTGAWSHGEMADIAAEVASAAELSASQASAPHPRRHLRAPL